MSKEQILEVKDLNAGYGAITALHNVNVTVNKGEIVSLIGANGAGKSTLLLSIFNIPAIFSGKIIFKGQNITGWPTHQISKLGISLVPEGRHIFPKMTVLENLKLGCTPIGDAHFKGDSDIMFSLFPVLKERRNQQAGTLSGGEQQMLAISRALMGRPELLLLDEPSLGLAPLIIKNIFATLDKISKEGTTIFVVEQNAKVALKCSTRGNLLVNGKVTLEDSAESMLNNPIVIEGYIGAV